LLDETAIRGKIDALCSRSGLSVPNEPIVTDAKNSNWTMLYGLVTFGDLFTARQLLYLLTLTSSVRQAHSRMVSAGFDAERARAVGSYMGVLVDRQADYDSTVCVWESGGQFIKSTFAQKGIPLVWDFVELAPFGDASGSPQGALDWVIGVIDSLTSAGGSPATVVRGSATSLPWPDGSLDAVVTDPPYYDNVPYADISDFFYVWLKRSVGPLYPEHFASEGTPKKSEAVADAIRHEGDRDRAKRAYEEMMEATFREACRTLKPTGQMVIVYAHKTTLGWATLVDALRRSGFIVTEAWPFDTERPGRVRAIESAALASSIFLVARKRGATATGSYEEEVRPELEKIVRERVDTLWKMGITGADLVIAAVGAGLRGFTRFSRVEYANGEEVPAEKFLAEVEGVVLETLLEKIFGMAGSGVAAVDGPSRFYVLWRYAYKAAEMDAGEAIVFTYGQNVELDGQKGLSTGRHALVEKKKGNYRLRDFTERGEDEKLGLPEDGGAPVPLVDALHRILWLMENQPRNLNRFLDEARPDPERLRLVAQALAGTALAGKKDNGPEHTVATTAAEQAALKKLVANWRALIDQRLAADEGTLLGIMRGNK
jgi:putative DNA methylase